MKTIIIIFMIFYSTICFAMNNNKCDSFNEFINSLDKSAQNDRLLTKDDCEKLIPILASEYPPYLSLERNKNLFEEKIENDFKECLNTRKIKYNGINPSDFSYDSLHVLYYCSRLHIDKNQLNNMFKGKLSPCERFMLTANKLYTPELSQEDIDFINTVFAGEQPTFKDTFVRLRVKKIVQNLMDMCYKISSQPLVAQGDFGHESC